jgi:hypothetical protein
VSRNGSIPGALIFGANERGFRMRTILILGALVLSGAASAQIAVPPGQDSSSVTSGANPNAGAAGPSAVPGYGTPHSPRNVPGAAEPEADETTGQAPRFDDRWPAATPIRPDGPTLDRGSSKTLNPDDSKAGMDE